MTKHGPGLTKRSTASTMPTVLLLDVSLSMSRPVASDTEQHTRQSLAAVAIGSILDYLSMHVKLEYVALVTYSSSYEVVCPFTREYDTIRAALRTVEEQDRTSVDEALHGVNTLVLSEWGHQTPVQIIIVTDGSCGGGTVSRSRVIAALPLPPPYPARIHVVPVAAPNEPSLTHAMPLYQKIVELASSGPNGMNRGAVYCPDQLSVAGVTAAARRLCERQYSEYTCTLRCGQLEARVQLFPPPPPPPQLDVADPGRLHRSPVIQVLGFLSQQELGTPITISKHLIIPQTQGGPNSERRENFSARTPSKDGSSNESSAAEEDTSDPSKVPSFCVLLHGALKVEGMAALVQLREGWWGVVSAWCEVSRSRRSCLLLCALQPGVNAAPWLGPLDRLGPAEEPGEVFPVRAVRSYSPGGAGGAAWARPHALLADVQKVLRHARKLPDKTQHLYKELNRLRRAAISLGFMELLSCVASALERECGALPAGVPAECALQLAHAAAALRDPRTATDVKHILQPLATTYVT